MKIWPILLTLPLLIAPAAKAQEGHIIDVKSPIAFKGVAKLVLMQRKDKQAFMWAEYPQFRQITPVTSFANWKLRTAAQGNYQKFAATVKKDFAPGGIDNYKPIGPYEFQQRPMLTYYYAPRLVSTARVFYEYQGGAHGMSGTVTSNYGQFDGMKAPKELVLGDFFTGTAYRKTVEKKIIEMLLADKEHPPIWIQDGSVKTLTTYHLNNFTVSPKGLTWYFESYAVAPYVSGEYTATIPFDQLGADFKRSIVLGR